MLSHLQETLAEARAVYENPDASQKEINDAWLNLTQAIQMLSFTADKAALQELVAECEQLDLSQYEDGETKDAFVSALNHVKPFWRIPPPWMKPALFPPSMP